MRIILFLLAVGITLSILSCNETPRTAEEVNSVQLISINPADTFYGQYRVLEPVGEIKGAVILLPGFGQFSHHVFKDSKIPQEASRNNLLTISWAGYSRLTADKFIREKLSLVLEDAIERYHLNPNKFAFGGFSAGGVIALRYTELANENPDNYPVKPTCVFMADSPVDLFHSYKLQEENLIHGISDIAKTEAQWVKRFYERHYGTTPTENPERFIDLSPFSIDTTLGRNERFLINTPIRAYHDVDIRWRIEERGQTARFDNYISTSELINRLRRIGNKEAEFMQSFKTGYRANGDRHPHSWSIIDAEECVKWIDTHISN